MVAHHWGTTMIEYVDVLTNFAKLAVHAKHVYHPPLSATTGVVRTTNNSFVFQTELHSSLIIIMAHLVTGLLDDNRYKLALHGSNQNVT